MKTTKTIEDFLFESIPSINVSAPASTTTSKAPKEVASEVSIDELDKSEELEWVENESAVIYDSDKVSVFYPRTKDQAIELGKEWPPGKSCKWPVAALGQDNTYNQNTFIEGRTFYFVVEKNPDRRWLVDVHPNRDVRVWSEESENEDQTIPYISMRKWFNTLNLNSQFFKRVKRKPLDLRIEDVVDGKWKTNPDGSIDVYGNVDISYKRLTKIPWKFGYVSGDFDCSWNEIESLEGSPQTVDGNFKCSRTLINNCIGGPVVVSGNFYCSFNKNIQSLEGAPETVGGNFTCSYNKQLQTVEDFSKDVGGNISCSFNSKLSSYKGFPSLINGKCSMTFNPKCVTLEGGPTKVDGDFNCANGHLINLIGGPKEVGGDYNCSNNDLVSFEGAPKILSGNFKFADNERLSQNYVQAFINQRKKQK